MNLAEWLKGLGRGAEDMDVFDATATPDGLVLKLIFDDKLESTPPKFKVGDVVEFERKSCPGNGGGTVRKVWKENLSNQVLLDIESPDLGVINKWSDNCTLVTEALPAFDGGKFRQWIPIPADQTRCTSVLIGADAPQAAATPRASRPCECGADKTGGGMHSSYCPKYSAGDRY